MQKHAHSDQAKRNKIVVALIIIILALATVTVMYLRAANEIESLESGEGRIQKASNTSIQGEMGVK